MLRKAINWYNLDHKTVFYSRDVKFYENIFSLKTMLKDTSMFDKELNNEINHLSFFDLYDQHSKGPNDEGRGASNLNGEGSSSYTLLVVVINSPRVLKKQQHL